MMSLTTSVASIDLTPRFNVAPTQNSPVVRQDTHGNRTVSLLRWGLVPHWASDPTIGSRLINARSEEAASKPSFRTPMKRQRCLVPASDFYEWQAFPGEKRKQPWAFRVKDAPLFAFAGLWEHWDKGGAPLETFTILTVSPNELIAPIHNRMPVIVQPEQYSLWLDPTHETVTDLAPILAPYPAHEMQAVRVSTRVNSPANDDASLITPV